MRIDSSTGWAPPTISISLSRNSLRWWAVSPLRDEPKDRAAAGEEEAAVGGEEEVAIDGHICVEAVTDARLFDGEVGWSFGRESNAPIRPGIGRSSGN